MTLWIASIDWDHSPDTGIPRQGYTILMPTRREAEKRVMDCINIVTGADPNAAHVGSYAHTRTTTRAAVTLAGMRIDYTIIEHEGSIKDPGYQVKEAADDA